MKTNNKCLVTQAMQGKIQNPIKKEFVLDNEGKPKVLPTGGSINYGVGLGTKVFGLKGDLFEPGVSIYQEKEDRNDNLRGMSNIGNVAKVVNGNAEGATGKVIGITNFESYGHVIINFTEEDKEKMKVGDEILIKAKGNGLELESFPQILIANIDPDLFEKLDIKEEKGKLSVDVRYIIPAMYNGTSSKHGPIEAANINISTSNMDEVKELGIEDMRIGDFVYLEDADNMFGSAYLKGACSVGIVVCGSGVSPNVGPGIALIMTSKENVIVPKLNKKANLANYFEK